MTGALLVLAMVVGALAPTTTAFARSVQPDDSVGIRLLDAPVERRDDPRALVYVVDHLRPGQSIERRIEVTNTTSETLDIQLYAAGARIEEGSFLFFEGREGNELSIWTSVEPSTVTVPADGAARATVRIAVPAEASEGERYAVLWAEPPASTGGNVSVINRVGIRIYLSVGPGGEPAARFDVTDLRAGRDEQGAPRVTVRVENTGGRALDLRGELSLGGGPGGLSAGPFETPSATTLGVGDSAGVTFSLDPALPAGQWDAEVTLRSGRVEESAAARISFPDAGEAAPVAAESSPTAWLIGAAGLLVLLILLLLLARRRKKKDRAEDASGPQHERRAPTP